MGTKAEAKARERRAGCWALGVLGGGLLLFVLAFILLMAGAAHMIEIPGHLLGGFVGFLSENIPRISFNAATWVPGVGAFFLAVVTIHRFASAWARKRERRWTLGTSLAVALVVPVLFVIAFLVPGVLLQVKQLSTVSWTQEDMGRSSTDEIDPLQARWEEAVKFASAHHGRFPDTLEEARIVDPKASSPDQPGGASADPVIYLGAGLTKASDPELALVISQPYPGPWDKPQRFLVTIDGRTKRIGGDQVNEWIQRSLEARQAAEK